MSTTQNNTAEIDGVCDMLHNMNTADNKDSISKCANCGKEGSDVTNTCNKCKSVKYCNATCKKKHRKKHKKDCERRVAELHDEALFKEPPSREDCPICFLQLPYIGSGQTYMACCGKVICCGCIYAVQSKDRRCKALCPFCRTPAPTSPEEIMERYKKRIEVGDAAAIRNVGSKYRNGDYGLPQNHVKALKLWHEAGELGDSTAHFNIGQYYKNGAHVKRDEKKANHYWELAAMGGDTKARHNLGVNEENSGNYHRALKHYMIAVEGGEHISLKRIQLLFEIGQATKDVYTEALRSYQSYLDEVKSDQRDEAAAAAQYKYYESAF